MIGRKQEDCDAGQQRLQSELPFEISSETTSNSNSLPHTVNNNDCPTPNTSPCLQQVPLSDSTSTWRSQVSELTTRTRKRDLILCQSIFLITSLVTAIMNCAITIFGMGIGVGLILGDTLRSTSRFGDVDTTPTTTPHVNANVTMAEESTVVVVRPATADCRAVIRRVPGRPLSATDTTASVIHSNPTLPAQ
jgi:hypothetical protein